MPYPVIDQLPLREAPRRGPWGAGRRRRDPGELPAHGAHEALVYKHGGRYVVDDGLSRLDDDHIAQATIVSVVDMREEAPAEVNVTIPAAGGSDFAVQVTFLCTVRRPDEVVEAGIRDMTEPLTHYLTRHQPLFHLGEDNEFEDVNLVRKKVTAEIKAYVTVRPPRFRGIDISLGSVQVRTTQEWAAFEAMRREKWREGILATEDQQRAHQLATGQQQREQLREIGRHRHGQDLERDSERHQQELASLRQEMEEMHELNRRRHEQLAEQMQQRLDHDREAFVRTRRCGGTGTTGPSPPSALITR